MKELGIFLIIIGLIVGVFAYTQIEGNDLGSDNPDQKYDLNCNVEVKNVILQKPSIGNVDCFSKKAGLFSLYSLFSDSGTLQIAAQGKSSSIDYKVGEAGVETYNLKLSKLASGPTSVTVTLYDEKNAVITTKAQTINVGGV